MVRGGRQREAVEVGPVADAHPVGEQRALRTDDAEVLGGVEVAPHVGWLVGTRRLKKDADLVVDVPARHQQVVPAAGEVRRADGGADGSEALRLDGAARVEERRLLDAAAIEVLDVDPHGHAGVAEVEPIVGATARVDRGAVVGRVVEVADVEAGGLRRQCRSTKGEADDEKR